MNLKKRKSPELFSPRSQSAGLSLMELVVGSALFLILGMALIKGFVGLVDLSQKTRKKAEAATVAEEIATRLKAIPFDHLYSLDPRTMNPPRDSNNKIAVGQDHFDRDYLIQWDVARSSPTFYALNDLVLSAGYGYFTVSVRYMIRQSNISLSDSIRLGATVPWRYHRHHRTDELQVGGSPTSLAVVCDPDNSNACFRDIDGDGTYYGPGETPQTGMKDVTVLLFDRNGKNVARSNFFQTETRLASMEKTHGSSQLKINVYRPIGALICKADGGRKEHLVYKSVRSINTDAYHRYYLWANKWVRCDTLDEDIWVNDSETGPTERVLRPKPENGPLGNFFLQMETALQGDLYVWLFEPTQPTSGVPDPDPTVNPNAPPTAVIPLVRQAGWRDDVFFADHTNPGWKTVQDALKAVNLDRYIYIAFQKRYQGQASAFSVFGLVVDVHPPFVRTFPPPGPYPGRSPLIEVEAEDPEAFWRVQYEGAQQIGREFMAYRIEGPAPIGSTWTYHGMGGPYTVSYDKKEWRDARSWQNTRIVKIRIVDEDELPSEWPSYGTYKFTAEFADLHCYKTSHSWTVDLWENPSDVTGPDVQISAQPALPLPDWATADTLFKDPSIDPTPVLSNRTYNFASVTLNDLGSGIKWKTVSLWVADDPAGTINKEQILLHGSASNPGNKKFGFYFDFQYSDRPTRLTKDVTYTFHDPPGKIRYIVIEAEDWRDNPVPPLHWRVQII